MSEGSFQVGDFVSPRPSYLSLCGDLGQGRTWPQRVTHIEGPGFSIEGEERSQSRWLHNYEKVSPTYLPLTSSSEPRLKSTNPKTAFGLAKSPIGLIPPIALVEMAESFRHGADKYGPANWREDAVSSSTYRDALFRHLLAWCDREDIDPASGASHLGHVMANAAILLDAASCGKLLDDRPTPGHAAEAIAKYTKKDQG